MDPDNSSSLTKLGVTIRKRDERQFIEFDSVSKARHWIDEEIAKWKWLENQRQGLFDPKGALQNEHEKLTSASIELVHWVEREQKIQRTGIYDTSVMNDCRESAKKILNTAIVDGRIYSWTPSGEEILHFFADDSVPKYFAANLFCALSGSEVRSFPSDWQNAKDEVLKRFAPETIAALTWSVLVKTGLPDATEELVSKCKADLGTITHTAEAALKSKDEITENLKAAKKTTEDLFEIQAESEKKFQTQMHVLYEEHSRRLEEYKKEFYEQLAVQSAARHWKREQRIQQLKSRRWGKYALVWGMMISIFLTIKMIVVMCYEPPQITNTNIALGYLSSYLAPFAAIIGLMIWGLRIIIRSYLSHSHLAADARERQLLVTCCLALLKSAEVNDPKDSHELRKQLLAGALESVFRHTQDGIVKDDAYFIPSSIARP